PPYRDCRRAAPLLTRLFLVGSRPAEPLQLAPPALRCEPLLDRFFVRPGRLPRPPDAQRRTYGSDEPLDRQLPVPQLAPFVLGHGAHDRAGARDYALLLLVGQR